MFKEYAKFYDLIYKNKPYKKEANFVYEWANKPKTILELGSGTGKHSKYWKAKIESIEQSQEMAYKSKNICHIGDIRTFSYEYFEKKFDACFALFNVVGYADPIYYMDKLPLKKGGYFIFDCWDSAVVEEEPPKRESKDFGEFKRIVVPCVVCLPYIKLQITIVKNNKFLFAEDHIVRSYWENEIWNLAEAFGYKVVDNKSEPGWVRWYKLRKI